MFTVAPSLTFNGQCAQAIELYKKAFDAKELLRVPFSETSQRSVQHKGEERNYIFQCQLQIGEQTFVLADDMYGVLSGERSNNVNILLRFDKDEDLQKVYSVLREDSTTAMPLQTTTYADSHVIFTDKFGISWELKSHKTHGKSLPVEVIAQKAQEFLKDADFEWCICGGYGLEMFAGCELRYHGDFDIAVFSENRRDVAKYLMDRDWPVYVRHYDANDPNWAKRFHLLKDENDPLLQGEQMGVWSVKHDSFAEMIKRDNEDTYTYVCHEPRIQDLDFIEVGLDTREGDEYVLLDSPRVARAMDKAIMYKDGIPFLAPEIILFFKSDKNSFEHPYSKPKSLIDYKVIVPMLSEESRQWLRDAVKTAHPDGCEWLDELL